MRVAAASLLLLAGVQTLLAAAPLAPLDLDAPRGLTPFAGVDAALRSTVKLYGAGIATQHGYGTGILVSEDGKVVTVLSLVIEASSLRVGTSDGHIYPAEVLYRDEYRQLALLQVARRADNVDTTAPMIERMARARFEPFAIGTSSARHPGEPLFVVGNPFKVAEGDEPLTIMRGVLSGRTKLAAARNAQPFPYLGEILLIDAITSGPGQGGSAIVDVDGKLIGIAGKSVTSRQTNTLLNYALPVEEIAAFLKDAEQGANAATRPAATQTSGPGFHGITLSKIGYQRQLPFVRTVAKGSPADQAGVRPDDLIVSANGTAVPRGRDFTELCDRLSAGDELALILKRGEQLISVRIVLAARKP